MFKIQKMHKEDKLLESALKMHKIPKRTPPKSRFSNPFFQKIFHQEIQCIQCTLLTLINSRCWSDFHWDDYINKNSPISRENDSADHFVGMKNLIEGRLLVNIPLRMIGQRLVKSYRKPADSRHVPTLAYVYQLISTNQIFF